nr:MAG TPA: putative tail component [Caudoviricetes sp.]
MKITLEDHSAEVYKELEAACQRALEKCGLAAVNYATKLCPVVTGDLRDSITHKVIDSEKAAYIGTNSEYATYVEMGTGVYGPAPTSGYWVYVRGGESKKSNSPGKRYTLEEAKRIVAILRRKGLDAHMTDGRKATPFIKPAVANHAEQYQKIIKRELKNG